MVFLILIVVMGVPIIFVAAKLIVFAFWLSSNAFSRIENKALRFACRIAFLAIMVGISIPISRSLQPLLPDFRVQGDGGVGMAQNALSVAALFAALPCGLMIVLALVLRQTVPVIPETSVDPFDSEPR